MIPILIDEGLPPQVAKALRALGLDVRAIGEEDEGAPPRASTDDANCAWCAEHGALLVTNDRGKGDKLILDALAAHRVHAIFVTRELRSRPPHHLARALLASEESIAQKAGGKGLIRARLRVKGGLEKLS